MLIGRTQELSKFNNLASKKTASLVVLKGRRRIGKSYLAQEYGKGHGKYFEIVGLAPRDNIKNEDQLKNFGEQLSLSVGIPGFSFENWTQAFEALAKFTEKGKVFILIDEISWMGSSDKDFVGKLKIAWDKFYSKNPNLMMVLCGSVSSWIDKNILNNTDFVGRISWQHQLGPLPLSVIRQFWGKNKIIPEEILKVVAITGAIPKYLEEINPKLTAEQNIEQLCFDSTGYLFNDFQKIFNDIFTRRAPIYKKMLKVLSMKKLSPSDLAKSLGEKLNSDLSEYIHDLEQAGFIAREYTWNLKDGKDSKLSQLRIRDNYVRFYLKYIDKNSAKIAKGTFKYSGITNLLNWDTIIGYLFEGLVLENLELVFQNLNLQIHDIEQFGPYFQTQTKKRAGCQIDLLIQNKMSYLYLCEMKYKKKIGIEVIKEVEQKIERLDGAQKYSIRPVLIYCGELSKELEASDYFVKMLDFRTLI